MTITSSLYRAARYAATARALTSGNPRRVVRRGKNIALGRALGRVGAWRRLWR